MKHLILFIIIATVAQATEYKYEYVPFKATYDQAVAKAAAKGGTLVIIKDAVANTAILKLISKQSIWIGLTDRFQEGKWLWTDGTPVVYHNWRQKPKRRRSANCTIMDLSGMWLDVIGHDKRPYVIQYKKEIEAKPENTGLTKYEIKILQVMSKMSLKDQKRFVEKILK